ncbi:hypothetical protein [Burkholderia gladioli]|uniref:hypothetical protein n=1 Tax=Burkholderia gladioli TaxID=28095 RepID=UPI00163EC80B|nr:hypothetical protein [Burkholderia gladioli]
MQYCFKAPFETMMEMLVKTIIPWFASLLVATALASTQAAEAGPAGVPQPLCKGGTSCQIDGFSVQFFGCGDGGLYGAISASGTGGVTLNDRIDGHGQAVGRLKDNQFVCVAASATARRGGDPRYYVIAIPTRSVPACNGNALCEKRDLPITWNTATTGKACQLGGDGLYHGDCAAGWIDEGQLDQYANGL